MASGSISTYNDYQNSFSIALNTDLDNCTTPGVYRCETSTIAASLTNCPVTYGFTLIVSQISAVNRNQLLIGSNCCYVRLKTTSGGWGNWYRMANTTTKTYTVTLETNANVSPFSTYAQLSLSNDVSAYGDIIGVVSKGKSTDPISIGLSASGVNVFVWGRLAEEISVTVTFQK